MNRIPRGALAVVLAIAARPLLWPVAMTTLLRLARPGWWRRWPLLPLPAAGYLHFRMVTAYGGDGEHPLVPSDVVAYLRWCRRRQWPGRRGSAV